MQIEHIKKKRKVNKKLVNSKNMAVEIPNRSKSIDGYVEMGKRTKYTNGYMRVPSPNMI